MSLFRIGVGISIGAFVWLGGCATPEFRLGRGVTPQAIIRKIECEIDAAARKYPRLVDEEWVASAVLYVQVDEDAGLTPTLSFIEPVTGGSFAFNVSGKLSGSTQRIFNESFAIYVWGLNELLHKTVPGKPLDRSKVQRFCASKDSAGFGIIGDLGIVEIFDMAFTSFDKADIAAGFKETKDQTVFGQTVQFVVTKNLNAVGPNWTLSRFKGPGGFLGAGRTDTHKLVVSFAPTPQTGRRKFQRPGQAPLAGSGGADYARALGERNNQMLLLQGLPSNVAREIQRLP